MTQVWKAGDTAPALRIELTDGDPPVAVALTTATEIRLRTSGAVTLDRVVTGDANGLITYQWQAGDTDQAGTVRAEVRVTAADGRKQTFPPDGYLTIVIQPNLAAPSA